MPSSKRREVREASCRLPGDSDLHDLAKYLTGEIYFPPRWPESPRKSRGAYHWVMNEEWLQYLHETLGTLWEPPQDITAPAMLYGYEVVVDEKYGIPKLVLRDA